MSNGGNMWTFSLIFFLRPCLCWTSNETCILCTVVTYILLPTEFLYLKIWTCSNIFQDCFILDQGGTKIYVWKGKLATKMEKQAAMSGALVSTIELTAVFRWWILPMFIVDFILNLQTSRWYFGDWLITFSVWLVHMNVQSSVSLR